MYYSIKKGIRIGPMCDERAWIRVVSRDQSGSIAVYRLQAEIVGGISDGNFEARRGEVSYYQVLMHAGDDRVGVTRPGRSPNLARLAVAANPEFLGKTGKNPPPGVLWRNASLPISLAHICNPNTEFCMLDP